MTRTHENIPTPAIVITLSTVRKNLARMADYCRLHNLQLRPHFKTHKSLRMAGLQLDAGAIGLTCAKVGEAQTLGAPGRDLLLAYPALDQERTSRLAALAAAVPVRVAVDSALAVDRLGYAAHKLGATIGILVDIDVGFHRTGVQSAALAHELAAHVERTPGARLDGLMCYPGHITAPAADQPPLLAPVEEILQSTLALLRKSGLSTAIVSGGSTPTAFQSHLLPALTEIRPGTYIYNDRNTLTGGWCNLEQCAARILATVVSDAVPNKVVIDAGSKVLSSDRLHRSPDTAGFGLVLEFPGAPLARLSEEHGEINISASPNRPRLGERLSILPNHICPCINLASSVWLEHDDGTLEPLTIDARGCVV